MRKKIFLTAALLVSLIPMIANQYGTFRGVSEVSGLINLWNPIGIIAVVLYLIGVWVPFKNHKINKILGLIGLIGIVIAEIYTFLTWHDAKFNLSQSFEYAFPEFYLGLITSTLMIVIYLCTISCLETTAKRSIAKSSTTNKTSKSTKKLSKRSKK